MTIAAGFTVDDGLLFVADTKHQWQGSMQMESTKIFTRPHKSGVKAVFALIGDIHLAKGFIQHFQHDIDELTFTDQWSVRTAVENRLLQDYFAHINPRQDRRPDADFIFGIFSPQDKQLTLFDATGSDVNEQKGYTILGSGQYLGHYIMREQYQQHRNKRGNTHAIFYIAVDAFKKVKAYDDSCGRSTEVVWMGKNGNVSDVIRIPETDTDADFSDAWSKLSAFQK